MLNRPVSCSTTPSISRQNSSASMRCERSTFPLSRGVAGRDVDMANVLAEDVPVEVVSELRSVVGLDLLDLERPPRQDVVQELDGGLWPEGDRTVVRTTGCSPRSRCTSRDRSGAGGGPWPPTSPKLATGCLGSCPCHLDLRRLGTSQSPSTRPTQYRRRSRREPATRARLRVFSFECPIGHSVDIQNENWTSNLRGG